MCHTCAAIAPRSFLWLADGPELDSELCEPCFLEKSPSIVYLVRRLNAANVTPLAAIIGVSGTSEER
jgi:hypothetical protein